MMKKVIDKSVNDTDEKRSMKPFDKILVKAGLFNDKWHPDFFECYLNKERTHILTISGIALYNDSEWEKYTDDEQYKRLVMTDDDYVQLTDEHLSDDDDLVGSLANSFITDDDEEDDRIEALDEKMDEVINTMKKILEMLNNNDDQISQPYFISITPCVDPLRPYCITTSHNSTNTK